MTKNKMLFLVLFMFLIHKSNSQEEISKAYKKYLENKIDTMRTRSIESFTTLKNWDAIGYEEYHGKNNYLYFSSSSSNKDTVFIFVNDKFYRYFVPNIDGTDFHEYAYKIRMGLKQYVKIKILHHNEAIEFFWPKKVPTIVLYYYPHLRPCSKGWSVEYSKYRIVPY